VKRHKHHLMELFALEYLHLREKWKVMSWPRTQIGTQQEWGSQRGSNVVCPKAMGEEAANLCGGPQMESTDSTQVGERLDGAYGPAGSNTVLHARTIHKADQDLSMSKNRSL
jgi:hypothetical protein